MPFKLYKSGKVEIRTEGLFNNEYKKVEKLALVKKVYTGFLGGQQTYILFLMQDGHIETFDIWKYD